MKREWPKLSLRIAHFITTDSIIDLYLLLNILQVTFSSLSEHKLPECRKTSRNWQISQSDNLSGCFKVFQASVAFTLDKLGIKYATGEIHCWIKLFHSWWDTIAHMWIDCWKKNVKQSIVTESYLIIQN